MDPSNEKLHRLRTNESVSGYSIFSRNDSDSSMTTVNMSPYLSKSISFTKVAESSAYPSQPNPSNSSNSLNPESNFGDALHTALSKIASNQGQPKSINRLNTTPTNEPVIDSKWCIILVGLPAAGKSSICKNLKEHSARAFGDGANFKIDSFNAGHFRRKLSDFKHQTSNYFDANNREAKSQRDLFAQIALEHLLNSLISSQIDVGIFDATNSTRVRRDYIMNTIKQKEELTGIKINTLLLHIKCTDQHLWRYNVEGKTTGPDYIGSNHDNAVEDFIRRTEMYRQAFEDISTEELEQNSGLVYMEIDNAGKKVCINCNGFQLENDAIYKEFKKFVEDYYKDYGQFYEIAVEESTALSF